MEKPRVYLSSEDEEFNFKSWIWGRQEPTLDRPPNLENERKHVRQLASQIQNFWHLFPNMTPHDFAVVNKFYEWSVCRLLSFDSLPDDVMFNIFRVGTFCSPENRESSQMPLLFSQVCRRWRKLAHSASWLWSFLSYRDVEEAPYLLTRHFLRLSRASPLIIKIDISDTHFDYEEDHDWPEDVHLDGFLSVVLPHAHRWRSFHCVTDNWEPMAGVIEHLNQTQLPLLNSLELHQNFPLAERLETLPTPPIFASAPPSLNHLHLYGIIVNWQLPLNFSPNLTELTIQLISFEEAQSINVFLNVLYACRNSLRKLSLLDGGPLWNGEALHYPTLRLHNLEHFEFVGSGASFQNGYNLARLRTWLTFVEFGSSFYKLTLGTFLSEQNFDDVIPLFALKFNQVRFLRLGHMTISAAQVARWLYAIFPKITTLELFGDILQDAVFSALTRSPRVYGISSNFPLCSKLKTLSPFSPEPAMSIPSLIRIRQQMGVPLTTLVWDINHREDLEEVRQSWDLPAREIRTIYQGQLIDPENIWVGPNMDDDDDMNDDDE